MFAVWMLVIIVILMVLGMTAYIGISEILDDRKLRGAMSLVAGICAAVNIFVAAKIGISSPEQQMNTDQSVKVYDTNGNLIKQFEGKITASDSKIIIKDKNGKNHTVYYNSGIVIIEEIE